jgi:hypothetical protein
MHHGIGHLDPGRESRWPAPGPPCVPAPASGARASAVSPRPCAACRSAAPAGRGQRQHLGGIPARTIRPSGPNTSSPSRGRPARHRPSLVQIGRGATRPAGFRSSAGRARRSLRCDAVAARRGRPARCRRSAWSARHLPKRGRRGAQKASASGPSITTTAMPGLVQNCPAPMVSDPAQPCAMAAPRAPARGQQEHRVHLTQARQRTGSGRGARRRGRTARAPRQRPGEAHGADQRVLHQRLAHIAPPPWIRLNTPGCSRRRGWPRHRLRHDLARAGMGGMALDHHRAARGQRRGRVAARDRKGQREVRRAEHGHRADGALHHLRGRGAAGACGRAGPRHGGGPDSRPCGYGWRTGATGRWCAPARPPAARRAGRFPACRWR